MPETPGLRRSLSTLDATMINIGTMVGSGIFVVPATVVFHLHSTELSILTWVLGGIVSLFAAFAVAELGALMPQAGGQFVYLSKAYGPLWGYLYGWAGFAVVNTASISAIAVASAQYLTVFLPMSDIGIKITAVASIAVLTAINCFGVKLGASVQNLLTFFKIVALIGIGVICFSSSGLSAGPPIGDPPAMPGLISSIGLALIAVLWAYDGWNETTFVAGEVKNPKRALPVSIIVSTAAVVCLFSFFVAGLHHALPLDVMATSSTVVSDAVSSAVGEGGSILVTIAILVSLTGTNNAIVLTAPRIYYAMAERGLCFRWISTVHPRFHTPVASLLLQGAWASVLVFVGSFNQLITYIIFASWIFYAMSAGAVVILRRKTGTTDAGTYRTWGYPVTNGLFILFAFVLVAVTIAESPVDALIGTAILLAGVPAYWYWKRHSRETSA